PAPSGAQAPPAGPTRTNRLAIVALVTGVLGLVLLAVGFGIAALLQAGGRGEKGKGLAIGGLVAAGVWTVGGVVALLLTAGSMLIVERDESGNVTGEGRTMAEALRTGDCFDGFDGDEAKFLVTALPCSQPHDGEVIAKVQLSGDAYPGDEQVAKMADEACYLKNDHLQKSRHAADLEPYNIWPIRTTWNDGDRQVVCLMHYTGAEPLTSPLGETLDPGLRLWDELTAGDCLTEWDDESFAQRVVPCAKGYRIQVYATFAMEAGPYPGEKGAERRAERGCEQRQVRIFRGHRLPDLVWALYPEEWEWEAGQRTAVCFGESEKRTLKKPMLPR
ncbi:hypothetical protein E1200_05420, partial [Actinomadura sp. GC306]|uniref:DUF4190 domain-containing protein n=1 Tax=Actinomadura sp. GC306 TaxID=2530367 RepID=UPI0010EA3BD2